MYISMRYKTTRKIILWITFAVFALYALSLLFPFVWVLLNAFKTNAEFFDNVWRLPKEWKFSNFADAFKLKVGQTTLPDMLVNSLILVVGGTVLSVFFSVCAAYVVAKYKFKGSGFIYTAAIIIMLVPTVGSLSASYKLMVDLKLYNTYIGVLLQYSGGFGFNFILLYGFLRSISWSYAEAGQIDGCSDFRIFISIMLPQAVPALFAVGIVQAIGLWNDYFTPYMFLRKHPTLAVGMQQLVSTMQYGGTLPVLFALMLISLIPVIAVFSAFQKTIIENTVAGGLKG
ncbi:sugar ABC transporter permease [Clostridia bacterium]|nr:sugar ABC transporter permease [Clostridia bacterium]